MPLSRSSSVVVASAAGPASAPGAAFLARVRVAGAFAGAVLAAALPARLAGAAAGAFAAALVGAALVARLAGVLAVVGADAAALGSEPVRLAAEVLVAVRFTGSSVAGLAFVAATYTLSVCWLQWARARATTGSAMWTVGG